MHVCVCVLWCLCVMVVDVCCCVALLCLCWIVVERFALVLRSCDSMWLVGWVCVVVLFAMFGVFCLRWCVAVVV